jgi:hypothetical protein
MDRTTPLRARHTERRRGARPQLPRRTGRFRFWDLALWGSDAPVVARESVDASAGPGADSRWVSGRTPIGGVGRADGRRVPVGASAGLSAEHIGRLREAQSARTPNLTGSTGSPTDGEIARAFPVTDITVAGQSLVPRVVVREIPCEVGTGRGGPSRCRLRYLPMCSPRDTSPTADLASLPSRDSRWPGSTPPSTAYHPPNGTSGTVKRHNRPSGQRGGPT